MCLITSITYVSRAAQDPAIKPFRTMRHLNSLSGHFIVSRLLLMIGEVTGYRTSCPSDQSDMRCYPRAKDTARLHSTIQRNIQKIRRCGDGLEFADP